MRGLSGPAARRRLGSSPAGAFRTYRFDRRGHGRTSDVGAPITFDQKTADAIAFIGQVVGEPAPCSAARPRAAHLLIALERPDLLGGLVFFEGVGHVDGWKPGGLDPLPDEVHEFLGGL